MSGERRPRPDTQVRASLTAAMAEGLEFDDAWPLAIVGNVCDSYRSARGGAAKPLHVQPELTSQPPNLRASASSKRCAGCRFVAGAGRGLAHCGLYGVEVFPGVLWPHRTEDRHEWQGALLGDDEPGNLGSMPEWRAAYEGRDTTISDSLDVLARAIAGEDDDDGPDVESGSVAA